MAIQWKQPEAKDRLLAAVIATSFNLDMNEVARLFGQGATYDAIEGQLRKAKKAAVTLKEEAAGRAGPVVTPSRSRKIKNGTDSPIKTPVKGGRVTKTKKATTSKIKAQGLGMLFDAAINGTGSDEAEEEVI